MSYPCEAISLPRANVLVYELEELGLVWGVDTPRIFMFRELCETLRTFGVSAKTVVKTAPASPGATSVLQFLRMNIVELHYYMEVLLGDWYAKYEVDGRDEVASFFLTCANQGCQ